MSPIRSCLSSVLCALVLFACGESNDKPINHVIPDASVGEGDTGPGPKQGPCKDVDCDQHGSCHEQQGSAICRCDDGFHDQGLACLANNPANPCEGVPCSGQGDCAVDGNLPSCTCDDGYHAENLTCLENNAQDLCKGVSCSGHGSCVIDGNQAGCNCNDGFHALGLSCTADATLTCQTVTVTCVAGGGMSACAKGYDSFYKFGDGTVLHDVNVALAYCNGETSGTEDGICAGIATPCSQFDVHTCAARGCDWLDSISTCSGAPACSEGYNSALCNPIDGCYWTDPAPANAGCTALQSGCVRGRRYRFCSTDGGRYEFEDDTILHSVSAAVGYCQGETTGTDDGECSGTAIDCGSYTSADACSVQSGCDWLDSITTCSGFRSCSSGLDIKSCRLPGCSWSPAL